MSQARQGPAIVAARARAGFAQRFIDQARQLAGPDATEPDVEGRAELLRRAYFARLALKSAQARSKKHTAASIRQRGEPGRTTGLTVKEEAGEDTTDPRRV